MKKCIILVRVSTTAQNFDEQEKQLFELAKSDGYSDDNIIPIAEKESGIKLKEDERKGLNKMKEYIESDKNIDSVYIYHIDRLSRRKAVLFSIVEYLQERKIQLVVKDPSIKLFNADGKINDMADIVFGLFASLAEAEMRTKKERFKRTKQANKLIGKYNGATLPFGYMLNENKYIVPDPINSEIVRRMYDMYVNEGYSLCKIKQQLGYEGMQITTNGVRTILSNKNNVGIGDYKLEPIIDKETFNKAQEQFKKNIHNAPKTRIQALCTKLIVCEECGCHYTTKDGFFYACSNHTKRGVNKLDGTYCQNNSYIKISALDKIVWQDAAIIYSNEINNNRDKVIEEKLKDKEKLNLRLNILNDGLSKIDSKLNNISELFIEGIISKDKMNSKREEVLTDKKNIDDEIISIKHKIELIDEFINAKPNEKTEELLQKEFDDIMLKDNYDEMKQIVNKTIEHIQISGTTSLKHVFIHHYNNTIRSIDYKRTNKGCIWTNDEYIFLE